MPTIFYLLQIIIFIKLIVLCKVVLTIYSDLIYFTYFYMEVAYQPSAVWLSMLNYADEEGEFDEEEGEYDMQPWSCGAIYRFKLL